MSETIRLVITGKAEPRGSKVQQVLYDKLTNPKTGEPIIDPVSGEQMLRARTDTRGRCLTYTRDDNPKSGPWMKKIASAARKAFGKPLLSCPLEMTIRFYLERPKFHFGTGRNAGIIKERFIDAEHTVRPDRLKLARAVEDALADVLYVNDAQTVRGPVEKHYVAPGSQPRVEVEIIPLAAMAARVARKAEAQTA